MCSSDLPCRYLERNGFEVSYIQVDRDGIIDLEQFEEALDENTVLVSVMSANNEVGTIQPLKQIASFKDKYDFILHTNIDQHVEPRSDQSPGDGVADDLEDVERNEIGELRFAAFDREPVPAGADDRAQRD